MKHKSPGQHTPRVINLSGRLAKVFPFAKVQRRDLPLLVDGYDQQFQAIRDNLISDEPDFPLLVGALPQVIALVHSIRESGYAVLRVHGHPGEYDLHFDFPVLPFPVEIQRGTVIESDTIKAYVKWSKAAILLLGSIEWKGSMTMYIERLLELATHRYSKFPHLTWQAFVTDFCQSQTELCSQEILNAVVRDAGDDLSAISILEMHDQLYSRADEKLQRMFRELLSLDPVILASWIPAQIEGEEDPNVDPPVHEMDPTEELPGKAKKKAVPRKNSHSVKKSKAA